MNAPSSDVTLNSTFSRRRFLGTGLLMAVPARRYGRILGANDRINVGVIGTGRMGRRHIDYFRESTENARVAAVCDVYEPNRRAASRRVPEADVTGDFREMLERDDIDAVSIAAPDHWHAVMTVWACEAGKDVYVEKPASRTIDEGRKMVTAARKHARVVQVGTQQRSGRHFQEAVQRIRAGDIGEVSLVRVWSLANDFPKGMGNPADQEPPQGLNWDRWLGPSPWTPYNPNRFGVALNDDLEYTQWTTFHYFWDYGGGKVTNWGVHLLDIVQWAMGVDYPVSVSAEGGLFHLPDNRETPDTMLATFRYPSFLCSFEIRHCNARSYDGRGYGIAFHGTRGTLIIDRHGYEIQSESTNVESTERVDGHAGNHQAHVDNFLRSMRRRERPISDIEIGHRTTSTAILGNLAYRSGLSLKWDGRREQVLNNSDAQRLLSRDLREPWVI